MRLHKNLGANVPCKNNLNHGAENRFLGLCALCMDEDFID
jgi:hypothetical protein